MKKILSTLLVAAMLLSMVIVAAVPASADDDSFWVTYGRASQHDPDFSDDMTSVPGYEYTDDGFHMTSADWKDSTPWGQLQTSETVSLKDGVYMQVRVDSYCYDASDKWFNVNIWSQPMIDEGSADPKWGHGVQTLIRPGQADEEKGLPGAVKAVSWYTEEFTTAGNSNMAEDYPTVVDGKNVITLEVKWESNSYAVSINGAEAPEKVITYMNETFGADDAAYIGFAMHADKKGGSMDCTVIKFGTSADDAETPVGTAEKEAENHYIEIADIVSADTVAAGQPAIIMTGDRANSHLKGTPKSTTGSIITITEGYDVHVVATKSVGDAGTWKVDNEVSYDIKDFPVAVCVTKNFCTCQMDGECMAFETASVYMMSGEFVTPSPKMNVKDLDMCYDPYVIGDDTYLYFYVDMALEKEGIEGRIHGARFDFSDIDLATPGANAFDIEMIAFFRSVEDMEAYMDDYFVSLGWEAEDDGDDDTTEAPDDDTTEAPVAGGDTTEAPVSGGDDEITTAAPDNKGGDDKPAGGCGSVVGFGAIAVVAMAAVAGFVTFKKKED